MPLPRQVVCPSHGNHDREVTHRRPGCQEIIPRETPLAVQWIQDRDVCGIERNDDHGVRLPTQSPLQRPQVHVHDRPVPLRQQRGQLIQGCEGIFPTDGESELPGRFDQLERVCPQGGAIRHNA